MKNIYFDHSATTPVDKKVFKKMLPYFSTKFGNASSIHSFGREAIAGVDNAREIAAKFFNCESGEIIFTSGATESNNLVLNGFIKAFKNQKIKKMHIIVSLIEHDAILEPCVEIEKNGVEVSYIQVKKNGVVDLEKFKNLIKDNSVLVSVMYANNEIGSIQPIREIGKIIKKINNKKMRDWQKMRVKNRGEKPAFIYFHTDATQAVNFLNCDTKYLHVDFLSMSGHKIYGPKGVGLLFVKKNSPLKAIQLGGHHENNFRSGTINVAGIVGLGAALELIKIQKNSSKFIIEDNLELKKYNYNKKWSGANKKIAKLRDMLIDGIMKNIPNVILNTDCLNSVPSHAHFSFLGVEGESILVSLDIKGIAVSTGSACASGSLKASYVLLAMGIKKEIAHNSIRFSLGKNNTEIDIKKVIKILPSIIKRLRSMNPEYNFCN